jgi:hypothetical protein
MYKDYIVPPVEGIPVVDVSQYNRHIDYKGDEEVYY